MLFASRYVLSLVFFFSQLKEENVYYNLTLIFVSTLLAVSFFPKTEVIDTDKLSFWEDMRLPAFPLLNQIEGSRVPFFEKSIFISHGNGVFYATTHL